MFKLRDTFMGLINKLLKDRSGLSIIELLMVMFLLVIVLVMGFSLYMFGITSFSYGEKQADIQQNARMVTSFISDQLRVAESIFIIDEYAGDIQELDLEYIENQYGIRIENPEENFYVYFLFLRDGAVYFQEIDGSDQPAVLLEDISTKLEFDLAFRKSTDKNNLLAINLSATEISSGRTYDLETEVMALNLTDINDDLLSDKSIGGTAIIYQVPAPYPRIKFINLNPQFNIYDESVGQVINVKVTTVEVSDDSEVSVEFWKSGIEGLYDDEKIENITITALVPSGDVPLIEGNQTEFNITLPTGSDELYFGNYFFNIGVETAPFNQHRLYYILPVIESIEVTSLPGKAREAKVKISTKGIPLNTEASACTIIDPAGDDLHIGLVEKTGPNDGDLEFYGFVFKSPDNPKIDSNGNIVFNIFPNDAGELTGKDIYVTAKIGRLAWWEGEEFLSANAYLSNLLISVGELHLDLTPAFSYSTFAYSASVSGEVEQITVTATTDDPAADMKINGDTVTSGTGKDVPLGEPGTDTEIVIIVTAEDGVTKETYIITVNRLAS